MCSEAERKCPDETGGALLGYRSGEDYVITDVLGPGPDAQHARMFFQPDYGWQEEVIARRFAETNGTTTYLGDWHTHPGTSVPAMSKDDRKVLRQIASCPTAGIDRPLMAILAGSLGNPWGLGVWSGASRPRRLLKAWNPSDILKLPVRRYGF